MATICPCCEIRTATETCTACGRVVCSECTQPRGDASPAVCYCGTCCAATEREWAAKRAKRRVKA